MKFFTLLPSDFNTQLKLPGKFCRKAKGDFSTRAVITTCLGKWNNIKVRRNEGGGGILLFYFYGGEWVNFVNRHELSESDILVFEHHGSFVFHASIFDATACLKLQLNFQPLPCTTYGNETRPVLPNRPTFTKTLTSTSRCLFLPTKMWRSNNLHHKTKSILKISGLDTVEWPANLAYYSGRNQDRMAVVGGWYDFVLANNLVMGDKCTFEIVVDASDYGYPENFIIIIVTKAH